MTLWAWRYSVAHGWQWIAERQCAPANAAEWLETFRVDEPGVTFKAAARKPPPCPISAIL